MNVFLAGGSGAIGVPIDSRARRRRSSGHRVHAVARRTHRCCARSARRRSIVDALDADALRRAVVARIRPTSIHQLTALPKGGPRSATRSGRDQPAAHRRHAKPARRRDRRRRDADRRRLLRADRRRRQSGMPPDVAGRRPTPCSRWSRRSSTRTAPDAIEGVVLRYGLFYGPETASTLRDDGDGPPPHAAARSAAIAACCRAFTSTTRPARRIAALERGARRQHLRHRRRRAGELQRHRAGDRGIGAARRGRSHVPAWLPRLRRAVHGADDRAPAAAVEREGAPRARLAAEVSDDSRWAAGVLSPRGVNHDRGRVIFAQVTRDTASAEA